MDSVIKLCSELSSAGEEYVLLTAGNEGNQKQFGSVKGRQFLQVNQDLAQRFFSYCYNAASTSMYMGGQSYGHAMEVVSMSANRNSALPLGHSHHPVSDNTANRNSALPLGHSHHPVSDSTANRNSTLPLGHSNHPVSDSTANRNSALPLGHSHHPVSDSTANRNSALPLGHSHHPVSDSTVNRNSALPLGHSHHPVSDSTANRNSAHPLGHSHHPVSDSAASTIAGALQSLAAEFQMGRPQNSAMMPMGSSGIGVGEGHQDFEMTSQDRDVMSTYMGNVSYGSHHSNMNIGNMSNMNHSDICVQNTNTHANDYLIRTNIGNENFTAQPMNRESLIPNLNENNSKSQEDFTGNQKENTKFVENGSENANFVENQNKCTSFSENQTSNPDFDSKSETKITFEDDHKKQITDETGLSNNQEKTASASGEKSLAYVSEKHKVVTASLPKEKHFDDSDDSNFSIGFETDFNLRDHQDDLKLVISNVVSTLDRENNADIKNEVQDEKPQVNKNANYRRKKSRKQRKDVTETRQSRTRKEKQFIAEESDDMESDIDKINSEDDDYALSDGIDSEATIVSDGENNETSCLRGAAKRKAAFQCHRCGVCHKTFANSSNLRRHEKSHGVQGDQRRCVKCNEFVLINDMKRHLRAKHANDNKKQKLHCKDCGKVCMSKSLLRQHVSKAHGEVKFKCDKCHKVFMSEDAFKSHMVKHLQKHVCGVCQQTFATQAGLAQHSSDTHHVDIQCEVQKCSLCGRRRGQQHKCPGKKIKVQREFICLVCNKHFSRIQNLNLHRRIHNDNRTKLKCELCDKLFSDRCSLKKHVRYVHSAERNFVCDVCGKSFKQNDTLKNHVRIHAEEKTDEFKCGLCSKLLSSKSALNVHYRSHTGAKPYMCEICGMSFRQVANMRKHMLIHTTAKANQCELCGKEYKYRDSWKAHMRSHVIKEGLRREVIKTKYGKVYNCEYCQKQFSTASQYKVHIRTHTDERPFKCDMCEKAFKEKGKLSRHVNRVHSQMLSMHPHQKVSMDSRIVIPVPNDHIMYYTGAVAGV